MKNKITLFIRNYGLVLGGILMLIVSMIGIRNGYKEKDITEDNRIVTVKIIKLSERRSNYHLKLEYKNKTFVERIDAENFRRIKGKKEVKMLTNKEHNTFIFSDAYEKNNNFLFGSLLGLIGLVIIYKGKKESAQKR